MGLFGFSLKVKVVDDDNTLDNKESKSKDGKRKSLDKKKEKISKPINKKVKKIKTTNNTMLDEPFKIDEVLLNEEDLYLNDIENEVDKESNNFNIVEEYVENNIDEVEQISNKKPGKKRNKERKKLFKGKNKVDDVKELAKNKKKIIRKRKIRKAILVIFLLYITFGAIQGYNTPVLNNGELYSESLFINDYINGINYYNSNDKSTDKLKNIILDNESIINSKQQLKYVESLSRELNDDGSIEYIILVSVGSKLEQFSFTLDKYEDKYLIVNNLRPINYSLNKMSDEDLSEYNLNKEKKIESNVTEESEKEKVKSSIELFFNSYNNDMAKLKGTLAFDLKDYGNMKFMVNTLDILDINKNSEDVYTVKLKIKQEANSNEYSVESIFYFSLDKNMQIINIE